MTIRIVAALGGLMLAVPCAAQLGEKSGGVPSNVVRKDASGNVAINAITVSGVGYAGLSISNVGTAGTTTYKYTVVGFDAGGKSRANSSTTSTANAILDGTNYNRVTVSTYTGAVGACDVYRVTGGATQGKIGTVASCASGGTLNDTGLMGDGGTVPTDTSGIVKGFGLQYSNAQPVDANGYAGSAAPRYVRSQHITFTEWADTSADWSVAYGTKDLDTTNYLSPHFQQVRLTCSNGQTSPQIYRAFPYVMNWRGKHWAQYFYIPDAAAAAAITDISVRFDTSAVQNQDNYQQVIYRNSSGIARAGWHLATGGMGISGGSSGWTATGSPDWATVQGMRFVLTTNGTTSARVVPGPLFIFDPPNAKGLVVIGMDGIYSGQEKAAAYASARGIPVTLFASEPLVGSSGRMAIETLQDLKRWGRNLIGSYVYPYQQYWHQMDDATRVRAVQDNARWLRENGLGDGARIISPPGVGYRSQTVERTVTNGLSDVQAGFNYLESVYPNLWDVRDLRVAATPSGITDAVLASNLRAACNGKTVFLSLWHSPYDSIDATQVTWETFIDATRSYIDAGCLEAVTPLDIWTGSITLANPAGGLTTTNLVADYDLTTLATGATAAYNMVSYKPNLTLGQAYSPTITASGLSFAAASKQYVVSSANFGLTGDAALTIEVIAKPTAVASAQAIAGIGTSAAGGGAFMTVAQAASGALGMEFVGDGYRQDSGTVTANEYHCLAVTKSAGAIGDATTVAYVNGAAVAGTDTGATTPNLVDGPLRLGIWPDADSYPFNGVISRVRMFSAALNATQIAADCNYLRTAMRAKRTAVVVK